MAAGIRPAGGSKHFWLRQSFNWLFEESDDQFLMGQVEGTRRALPVLAGLHFFATLVVFLSLNGSVPTIILSAWTGCSSILGLILTGASIVAGEPGASKKLLRSVVKFAPFAAMAIGVTWGYAALVLAKLSQTDDGSLIQMLAASVMICGLICTFRIPAAAVQFMLAPLAGWSAHAVGAKGDPGNLRLAVVIICSGTLAWVVFDLAVAFKRRVGLEAAQQRDGEIIKLLLHEFGDVSRDWMWESDALGKLNFHSSFLSRIGRQGLLNPNDSNFIGGFFGTHAPDLLPRFQARELLLDAPLTLVRDNETTYWQISAKPLIEGGVFAGYRGVARDVTELRNQEQHVAQARDAAEKALAARSQFLAVMSHELRTPINAIVGFSEILAAGQGENLPVAARREYLATILESASHLQGLINDVLEATRMERGNIHLDEQPNDAAELIEVSAKILRDQAARGGISIVARVVENVTVTGDLTRLKQVLLNVLSNAIKFSPEGGMVQIDMGRVADGGLCISVRDAGIGISQADVERVFEPFVQVDAGANRRFAGMGLGLAIARRVARMHGGDLILKGEKGAGTEARLLLPPSRVKWPKSESSVSEAA